MKNSTEWITYEFPKPSKVSSSTVYWFDDEPWGGCRVPQSWKLYYKDEQGGWTPVSAAVRTGRKRRAQHGGIHTGADYGHEAGSRVAKGQFGRCFRVGSRVRYRNVEESVPQEMYFFSAHFYFCPVVLCPFREYPGEQGHGSFLRTYVSRNVYCEAVCFADGSAGKDGGREGGCEGVACAYGVAGGAESAIAPADAHAVADPSSAEAYFQSITTFSAILPGVAPGFYAS